MRRFEFRLAAVLRHRGALLDQRRREFGVAQAEATAVAEQIRAMRRSRDLHQESIRAASTGGISRADMVRMRNYVNTLWLRMIMASRKLAELAARAEERRRAMVKAHQDVRALEILEEKARTAWQAEADREERVFLDDLRPVSGLLASPASAPASAGGEA
ncbi:MAG TPA: flagellar export protein FliJ [Planctomycetota bacterium]|nr:flagellar export protein FliJ [Planctomycetota bacterium]